jgi:hypothetical protein
MRDENLEEITKDIVTKCKNPIKLTFKNLTYEVTIKKEKHTVKQ